MKIKSLTFVVAVAVLVSSCTTPDGEKNRAASGAIVGAITGAVIGNQTGGDSRDRVIGAAIGAAAGAGIGHTMDEQERVFNEALETEQRNNEIEVQRVREDLLRLTLNSEVSFDTDSAEVKPEFFGTLNKLANVLVEYNDSNVTVVGHTDSTGSEDYNQALSERRARSFATYLERRGVAASRLIIQGEGESKPRADNNTAAGRAQNRRVEVFVQPRQQ